MELMYNSSSECRTGDLCNNLEVDTYARFCESLIKGTTYQSGPQIEVPQNVDKIDGNFINYITNTLIEPKEIKQEVPTNCSTSFAPFKGPPPLNKENTSVEPKKLKFPCCFCIKSFAKKQQLQNHTKTHTQERNFKCDTCEKCFLHKQQLLNHQKTHTGKKDFSCSYCSKQFMLKQQLQIHEKIHTGEKNFECNMCEKAFITKQQLQNHVNSHLGIKLFSCNECHKKFAQKQQLERHIKNHTLKQNFKCSLCNQKFLSKKTYNEHNTEYHRYQVCNGIQDDDYKMEVL